MRRLTLCAVVQAGQTRMQPRTSCPPVINNRSRVFPTKSCSVCIPPPCCCAPAGRQVTCHWQSQTGCSMTAAAPCCCFQQHSKSPYTCRSKPTHTQVTQCLVQARPAVLAPVSAPGVCLAQNYFDGICVCLFPHSRGIDMGRPALDTQSARHTLKGTSHACAAPSDGKVSPGQQCRGWICTTGALRDNVGRLSM